MRGNMQATRAPAGLYVDCVPIDFSVNERGSLRRGNLFIIIIFCLVWLYLRCGLEPAITQMKDDLRPFTFFFFFAHLHLYNQIRFTVDITFVHRDCTTSLHSLPHKHVQTTLAYYSLVTLILYSTTNLYSQNFLHAVCHPL